MGEKNYDLIKKLQEFIHEVNGKKYKFDPMYLVSCNVSKDNEKTFFCSELVAEALQTAGIMKTSTPSYKYLPSIFITKFRTLCR